MEKLDIAQELSKMERRAMNALLENKDFLDGLEESDEVLPSFLKKREKSRFRGLYCTLDLRDGVCFEISNRSTIGSESRPLIRTKIGFDDFNLYFYDKEAFFNALGKEMKKSLLCKKNEEMINLKLNAIATAYIEIQYQKDWMNREEDEEMKAFLVKSLAKKEVLLKKLEMEKDALEEKR